MFLQVEFDYNLFNILVFSLRNFQRTSPFDGSYYLFDIIRADGQRKMIFLIITGLWRLHYLAVVIHFAVCIPVTEATEQAFRQIKNLPSILFSAQDKEKRTDNDVFLSVDDWLVDSVGGREQRAYHQYKYNAHKKILFMLMSYCVNINLLVGISHALLFQADYSLLRAAHFMTTHVVYLTSTKVQLLNGGCCLFTLCHYDCKNTNFGR